MKKIYTFLILTVMGLNLSANPVAMPTVEISELYFDTALGWQIELVYLYADQENMPIDSIFICSSSGMSKIKNFTINGESGFIVITKDSLENQIEINQTGDSLTVISYVNIFESESSQYMLIFGNYANSVISAPRNGQSIARLDYFYSKDKTPTIGYENNYEGMLGTIKGFVYDKNSDPVSNEEFMIYNNFPFTTSENGEYSANVFSKPTSINNIYYLKNGAFKKYISITNLSYIMEPDSIININIYLIDSLNRIGSDVKNEDFVKIYPNPVLLKDKINVNVDLPVITSNVTVELRDISGKLINKKSITQSEAGVDSPDKAGIYIISVLLDNKIIVSKKIFVKNE